MDAGNLVPVYIDEALPADTIKLSATVFARLSTPIKPIMDNMVADIHFWSVPIRLIWENWRKFQGEQDNPADSINYIVPTITSPVGGYLEQSIYDYMGIPTKVAGLTHSALFNRAINKIYNEWYRDQNLINSAYCPTNDGPDTAANYTVLKRGKRKDYFTSALPWAQKGAAVTIPLGTTAPIIYNSAAANFTGATMSTVGAGKHLIPAGGSFPDNGFAADLSSATAATINLLRQSTAVQRILETDARGGTRLSEMIFAHFGVQSDPRAQRPEYLGGGSVPVNISPIAQQSATVGGGTPQGNLAAMGTFSINGNGFTQSFVEHCIVIGLLSVRYDQNYMQGLNRMFSRSTRYDFYLPALAHLGEQAVLNKEIYAQGTSDDNQAFGYQERWAEYRYKPSQITGLFRSNATGSLAVWHLAQNFNALPALNQAFIEVSGDEVDRVIAVPSEPQFLVDCYFQQHHTRPMPTFSVPSFTDKF